MHVFSLVTSILLTITVVLVSVSLGLRKTSVPLVVLLSVCIAVVIVSCAFSWYTWGTIQKGELSETERETMQKVLLNSQSWKCMISLCSHETRIPKIKPMIDSIVNQPFFDPTKFTIILNLPKTFRGKPQKYEIHNLPDFLNKPYIKPVLVDDIGPATKVVYAGLGQDDKTCVISVDDDIQYPNNFLETMISRWIATPVQKRQKTILAGSGIYLLDKIDAAMYVLEDQKRVAIFEGAGGVLYPSSFFSQQLIDWIKNLPKSCRMGDDFILSMWAGTHGFEAFRVNPNGSWMSLLWLLSYGIDGSTPALHSAKTDKNCGINVVFGCHTNTLNYQACAKYTKENGTEAQKSWVDTAYDPTPRPIQQAKHFLQACAIYFMT